MHREKKKTSSSHVGKSAVGVLCLGTPVKPSINVNKNTFFCLMKPVYFTDQIQIFFDFEWF